VHPPTGDDLSDSRPEGLVKAPRMPPRAWLMSAAALVFGLFAGFSIASESVPPAPLPNQGAGSPSPDLGELDRPTSKAIPGNGTYRVGADVRPGLYHSYRNHLNCAWTRARDASGETRSVIARDVAKGDAYVDLEKGEFFNTDQCTTWRRVADAM
jgi:hypothetical protein